ncbi:hypothetical protein [Clostridium sp. BJN0001]|uniref:hypothetical protein n=1 Tax=Clostridium sp. BJN0001 TaxID=2930219 RepID=UPI001FCFBB08|nr:hypothetical protein [Clostridium sp. BJN0001]
MKKIYNKKKFFSGIVFLILAVVTFFAMSIPSIDKSAFRSMESVVIGILCFLFGITEVYRSLNKKCTKEDRQNDDEREKLII